MVFKKINLIIDIEDGIIQDYSVIGMESVRMKDPEVQQICSDRKFSKCPHCFNDLEIVLYLAGLSGSVEYLDENNDVSPIETEEICDTKRMIEAETEVKNVDEILKSEWEGGVLQVVIEDSNKMDARLRKEEQALLDRTFSCLSCDKCLRNKAALIAHQRTCKLGPVIYDNKHKKAKFSREQKYQDALLRGDHNCQMCNKTFKNSAALIAHVKTCTGHDIRCDLCGEQFESRKKLSKHLSVAHNKLNHVCFVCGSAFKAKWLLFEHTLRHSGNYIFISIYFS